MRGREAYERYKEVAFLAKKGGTGKIRLFASYRLVEITFCGLLGKNLTGSVVSITADGGRMQYSNRNSGEEGECN